MEARETILVISVIRSHIPNEEIAAGGKRPIITPKLVATPLPPLPFKKMEKLCPKMVNIPIQMRRKGAGFGSIFLTSKRGKIPFAISRNKTTAAGPPPITL